MAGVPVTVWFGPQASPPPSATSETTEHARLNVPWWIIPRLRELLATPSNSPVRDVPVTVIKSPLGPMVPALDADADEQLILLDLVDVPGGSASLNAELTDSTTALCDRLSEAARSGRRSTLLAVAVTGHQLGAAHLVDPCSPVIHAARRCGWAYVQHIVVVHGTVADSRVKPYTAALDIPAQAADTDVIPHEVVHTDLLLFTSPDARI